MSYKTIVLKGDPLQKEAEVNTGKTIYPGMLVEYVTDDDTIQPHSTQGGNATAMVAIENSLEGQEIGDSYSAGDRADGENISFGDFLESKGNGYFQKHTAPVESSAYTGTEYTNRIVAQALEALNASSSGQGAALIKAVAV